MACPSAPCIWATPTTANARRPRGCWPRSCGLQKDQYTVTFQSRFGKAKWLEPYTEPTLRALARRGVARVDVVCPGFTGDCLETLEEIAQEGRKAFLTSGGKEFHYIPCLNDEAGLDRRAGQRGASRTWPAGRRGELPDRRGARAGRAKLAIAMGATR